MATSSSSSRRTTQRSTAKAQGSAALSDDQEEGAQLQLSDETDSADEWTPTHASKGKRRAVHTIDSDDDDDTNQQSRAKRRPIASAHSAAGTSKRPGKAARSSNAARSQPKKQRRKQQPSRDSEEEVDSEMEELTRIEREREEEEERAEAADEAKQLWEAVRARRQEATAAGTPAPAPTASSSAPAKPTSIVAALAQTASGSSAAVSLTSWLGASQSLEPTVSDAAVILDRDSLFIGFVFELTAPAERHKLVNHLARVIHPRIPTNLFPVPLQHLHPSKRGATHNMLAYRTLALKPGRDGSEGPEAFGTEQGEDDDGEKGGAKPITRAITSLGSSDCLVIVSRWYGGTMLGPVRFQHIETCAREALQQHMLNENLALLRQQLADLDSRIATVKAQITPGAPSSTLAVSSDTDPEKLQRLVLARQKQLAMLEKKLAQTSNAPASQATAQAQSHSDELDAAQRALAVLPP